MKKQVVNPFSALFIVLCVQMSFTENCGLSAQNILNLTTGNNWWLPDYVQQTANYGLGWVDGDFVKKWENYYPSDAEDDEIHFCAKLMFQWHDLNPAEGIYDWSSFDSTFNVIISTPHLGVLVYPSLESRMVGIEGWPGAYNSDRFAVPHWLETTGYMGKIVEFTSCGDPVYWTPESGYLDALKVFLDTLANHIVDGYKLKNHPRLQSVEMRCNDYLYGEGQNRCGSEEWINHGYTKERYVSSQKRMIDAYLNAFPEETGKLVFMTMDDRAVDDYYEPWEYAIKNNGWGFRDGQLEVWMRYIQLSWGIFWDQDTKHLIADETWHPSMINNSVMATELESLGSDAISYGPGERAEIHHYVSTLRALQSRRNWLYYVGRSYIYNVKNIRELTRYAQLSAGKTKLNSPDAWVWLRQCEANARYIEYKSDKINFPEKVRHSGTITIKNFERWLEQYDVKPDGNTIPVQFWLGNIYASAWDGISRLDNVVFNQWVQATESENIEYWARRTDAANDQNSIYFNIDNDWFQDHQHAARLLISFIDTNNSTWLVEYDDLNGNRQLSQNVITGNSNELKTVSFELNIKANNGFPEETDFRIKRIAGGDAVIHLVRLVKVQDELGTSVDNFKPAKEETNEINVTNYPNPVSLETTIEYSLPKAGMVMIKIYNIQGREIKSLFNDYETEGIHTISWNATNDQGNKLPNGIYIVNVKTSEETRVHRIILSQ